MMLATVFICLIIAAMAKQHHSRDPNDNFFATVNVAIHSVINDLFESINLDPNFTNNNKIKLLLTMHSDLSNIADKSFGIFKDIHKIVRDNINNQTDVNYLPMKEKDDAIQLDTIVKEILNKHNLNAYRAVRRILRYAHKRTKVRDKVKDNDEDNTELTGESTKVKVKPDFDNSIEFNEFIINFLTKVNNLTIKDFKRSSKHGRFLVPSRKNLKVWDEPIEPSLRYDLDESYDTRRIFKGSKTHFNSFPFMVSIHIMGEFSCSGCIISRDFVITAASCLNIAYKSDFFEKNLKSIFVRLASSHTTKDGETIPVQNVYFHPGYDPEHLINNLAIIGLEKRVHLSRQQKKIRRIVWDKTPDNLSNDTKTVLILGWGATKAGQITQKFPTLRVSKLDVYNISDCREKYSEDFIRKENFCAAYNGVNGSACSETERRVDDDEDRSNPQYIPKRGTFYEHDDRTAASGEESSNTTSEAASEKKEGTEPPTERRRPPRKSEIVNKWSHDKYNENEQMPKSRDELVAIYGYDIRNEDAPPHARRNRRYGRGPNKYTRTWEDEEAYRRQSAAQQLPRKPPTAEDFPELGDNRRHGKPRTPRPRSKSQPSVNESPTENGSQLRRNASIKTTKKPTVNKGTGRTAVKVPNKQSPKDKMPALENLTITANVQNNQGQAPRKVNATVAQQRPVPTDQARKKPNANNAQQPQPQSNPAPNKSPPQQQPAPQQQQQQQKPQQNQQQQQPASGGGSKRYSSLRQRPLADSYTPQQPQQQQPQQQQQPPAQQQQQQQQQQPPHRYHAGPAGYASDSAHAQPAQQHAHPQHIIHQVLANSAANNHASSPPHAIPATQQQPQHGPQVRLGMMEQPQMGQVPHPHHNMHNIPTPHTMGQIQPAQGYAPPAMMPAQYMQQSNSGAVFPGAMYPPAPHAPPHAPHAPPHAAHAGHAPPHALAGAPPHAPPHPTYQHQIYAPHHNYAGGVTYYNCEAQEPPAPVPRTQRRPTAAIPIVSPHHADRPANSSEKDNIDRIVENMFVRKPWPATHGVDSKEKQAENRSSQEPPSKESSQPNSLTSSSISTDSKPSESREEKTEEVKEEVAREEKKETVDSAATQESIATDA